RARAVVPLPRQTIAAAWRRLDAAIGIERARRTNEMPVLAEQKALTFFRPVLRHHPAMRGAEREVPPRAGIAMADFDDDLEIGFERELVAAEHFRRGHAIEPGLDELAMELIRIAAEGLGFVGLRQHFGPQRDRARDHLLRGEARLGLGDRRGVLGRGIGHTNTPVILVRYCRGGRVAITALVAGRSDTALSHAIERGLALSFIASG